MSDLYNNALITAFFVYTAILKICTCYCTVLYLYYDNKYSYRHNKSIIISKYVR